MNRIPIRLFLIVLTFSVVFGRPLLAAPQLLGHSVTLTWTPGVQPVDETVVSWNVYRAPGATSTYTLLSSVPIETPAYLDGSVAAGGSYSYVVTVVDDAGVESIYSQSATVTVPGAVSLLTVTTQVLPAAVSGGTFSTTIAASGGTAPYTWTASGVPGLSIDATGLLSGSPSEQGVFTEVITVTDSLGTTSTVSIPVTVAPPTTGPLANFPSGLAMYWTFDTADIVDGVLADRSGNGNTGVLIGNSIPVVGELNQALSFNGSTSYVTATTPVGALSQSLTLEAWINTANSTRNETLLSDFDSSNSGAGYILTTDHSGHLIVGIGGADVSAYPNYVRDNTLINDGIWHQVVVSISFESQVVKFYVDGILTSTTPVNLAPNGSGAGVLEVGASPRQFFGNSYTWNIDEVQVYNRVLTDAEVNSVFVLTGGQVQTSAAAEVTP